LREARIVVRMGRLKGGCGQDWPPHMFCF